MFIMLNKKKILIFISIIIVILLLLLGLHFYNYKLDSKLVMGGQLYEEFNQTEHTKHVIKVLDDDKYFRPSKLPIINTRTFDFNFFTNNQQSSSLPASLFKSSEDTIINYFSILHHAANIPQGKNAGCGTIGEAKYPYPIAYNFLSNNYKKERSYNQFLKSFENIGHINLIKLHEVPSPIINSDNRYFIEIETIEGAEKPLTYFGYYYGFIDLIKENNNYKISNIEFTGEDFLCAPYHGWSHNAEASVKIRYGEWCNLIKKLYPTKQNGYVKNIEFEGTDGNYYRIVFFQLTNDTDIEIAQYKKNNKDNWILIKLDPIKCLSKTPSPSKQ